MGVYVFASLVCPGWFKVGHHRITERRPNVWYRVARRGFKSCKCPPELVGQTDVEQLELLRFYPNLSSRDEKRLHRENKAIRVGEWYLISELNRILCRLETDMGGIQAEVSEDAKLLALRWAGK